jgi:hypothetical protein
MYLADWKGNLSVDKVKPFQRARYMYLVDWKEALPFNEVHVPCRLEGNPSTQRGTCTLLAI